MRTLTFLTTNQREALKRIVLAVRSALRAFDFFGLFGIRLLDSLFPLESLELLEVLEAFLFSVL